MLKLYVPYPYTCFAPTKTQIIKIKEQQRQQHMYKPTEWATHILHVCTVHCTQYIRVYDILHFDYIFIVFSLQKKEVCRLCAASRRHFFFCKIIILFLTKRWFVGCKLRLIVCYRHWIGKQLSMAYRRFAGFMYNKIN